MVAAFLTLGAMAAAAVAPLAAANPLPGGATNWHNPYRQSLKRAVINDPSQVDGKSFDFVIAGGGCAGLAMAARLSEWSNVTVLLIEAGGDGDAVRDQIDIPGTCTCQAYPTVAAPISMPRMVQRLFGIDAEADRPGFSYLNGLTLSSYDWAYETVSQTDSGNAKKRWPRGKGLGGSGAINGLYWNKGDEQEYDAWGRKSFWYGCSVCTRCGS